MNRVGVWRFVALALALLAGPRLAAATPPNIVLVLADDLGFSDLAPYGSEIDTPTLGALAREGIRFTNYHTAASCAPTRGMLLTGVDSHRNGVPNIPETISPQQQAHANYRGTLGHNVVTVASLLQDAGYHTYMAGKWHLGQTPDLLPFRRGFERTVTMADSGADNWEQKAYIPIYPRANWYADGERTTLPGDFYSSRFLVDKMIEFIDANAADGRPFFAYLPFQAVHIPVQAPAAFRDKYQGVYDAGWTELRKQRLARARELGIVPPDAGMVTMSTTGDWASYSPEMQRYHARRMEVYAGMVDAMDHHLGRLVEHLKRIGRYQDTVFIFTSDNGSEASGGDDVRSLGMRLALRLNDYSNDYDTLGEQGSFNSIGPSFASAAAGPLAFYKFYAGEGGMRVPLIMAGAPLALERQQTDALAYVTDITPTILALADVSAPPGRYGGRPVEPMVGRSLLPLLRAESDRVYGPDEPIGYELAGNAALFLGDYKLVRNRPPVGDDQWHLYNIVTDPGETRDLAGQMPQRFERMQALYEQYAVDNGVLPVSPDYDQASQGVYNALKERFTPQILLLVLTFLVLLPFWLFYRYRRA